MTTIGSKLQLKPAQSLLVVNAPEAFEKKLKAEGYTFTHTDEAPSVGTYEAVQLFVHSRQELEQLAPGALAVLQPQGMFWIAYPKKSSGTETDLTRDEGWKIMAEMGYGGVRQVAIDETWSALRFKHENERKTPSMFGTDMPGIDRATKTVLVPEDLRKALEEAQLLEAFEKLAFTHRKEYVVAVLEAKRPETRINRIRKTVEAIAGKAK